MKNRIILGSANFDQTYGIKRNFIRKSEIKKLLNLASKNGIKTIDKYGLIPYLNKKGMSLSDIK